MFNLELIQHLFEYRDGKLYWKNKPSKYSNISLGTEAGSLYNTGYRIIKFSGYRCQTHRLIYFYHYGHIPKIIDHIDSNPLNNKIENLREATSSQNAYNTKINTRNKSGVKGVYFHKKSKKYVAQCTVDGFKKNLGGFTSLEEAENFVKKYRELHHGEFVNHGI
jgi:hypothetical protein